MSVIRSNLSIYSDPLSTVAYLSTHLVCLDMVNHSLHWTGLEYRFALMGSREVQPTDWIMWASLQAKV